MIAFVLSIASRDARPISLATRNLRHFFDLPAVNPWNA